MVISTRQGPPYYTREVLQRIVRARETAYGSPRRAWQMGPPSIYTGDRHYWVGSFKDAHADGYIVTVRTHAREGGFVYSLGEDPVVWVRCECKASTIPVPCKHGARVQLRLEREAREEYRENKKEVALWSE